MRDADCNKRIALENTCNEKRNASHKNDKEGVCMVEIPGNYTGFTIVTDEDPSLADLYENPTKNVYD